MTKTKESPIKQAPTSIADVVLVTCVKTKSSSPSPAKDLYTSPLLKRQRSYAESLHVPWFILSAEHGLVAPDEWLAPYERYLPDTPKSYRSAWGAWVAERLDLLVGSITGKVIEIHASAAYLDALRPHLESRGATTTDPLRGLTRSSRLSWYGSHHSVDMELDPPGFSPRSSGDHEFVVALLDAANAVSPDAFLSARLESLRSPGLYSWWIDDTGAADISRGLGEPVEPGLIYAGLAGATRWPSGRRSNNTLWLRIATMHLGGSHEFSTFRRSLGAVLASVNGSTKVDEAALTQWMRQHLRVVAVPFGDRDELGRLEVRVLESLDPPLNLKGMPATPLRLRLKELRSIVAKSG